MNRNVTMTLVWLGGLLAGLGALFVYELLTFDVEQYEITWQTGQQVFSGQGELQEGSEATFQFPAAAANVTALSFVLTWSDTEGEPDAFAIDVQGPEGFSGSTDGTDGTLTLMYELAEVLPPDRVEGLAEENAIRQSHRPVGGPGHSGNWTVTVRLTAAPGQVLPVVGVETVTDGTSDFRLEARYENQYPVARRL